MKKIRVSLSILAIVFAVGGAIASQLFSSPLMGFEYINDGESEPRCEDKIVCDTQGDWDCRVNTASPILRSSNDPVTSCGAALKRTTAPPQP